MKRLILGLVVGGAIFGATFGIAAALGVSTDDLGAGDAVVASCDPGGVTTSYTVAYESTILGYKVETVTVAGIASPDCNGQTLSVTLTDGGVSLAEKSVVVAGVSANLAFGPEDVLAAAVDDIHVVITGP